MIKGIVLDIDGVIVGEKVGFNSPYPHPDVIHRLKEIKQKGIPVFLCTAKPHYSIQKIIQDAELSNLHITNGGSVIINPLDNKVLKKHIIDKEIAFKIISLYISHAVYTEFYTVDDYFIQKDKENSLTQIHSHILQKQPIRVNSLADEAKNQEMVKIMPIARNDEHKDMLIRLFEPFNNKLTLSWGIHPIALPHVFGIITAKGISKEQALAEIANNYHIPLHELLGIGDSISDWQYIKSCGFAATLENGNDGLKKLIQSKEKSHFYIGKSVDENGILEIFDYFNI